MNQKTETERIADLEVAIKGLATKEEIATIVRDTMLGVLKETGRVTKLTLITVATIVGAIVVIGGGLKWLLGLFGFMYIK